METILTMHGGKLYRRPSGKIAGSVGDHIADLPADVIWTTTKLRTVEAAYAARGAPLTVEQVTALLGAMVAEPRYSRPQ